ncbi:hypothetical protein NPIL_695021, partial [Nephila pilipes]
GEKIVFEVDSRQCWKVVVGTVLGCSIWLLGLRSEWSRFLASVWPEILFSGWLTEKGSYRLRVEL